MRLSLHARCDLITQTRVFINLNEHLNQLTRFRSRKPARVAAQKTGRCSQPPVVWRQAGRGTSGWAFGLRLALVVVFASSGYCEIKRAFPFPRPAPEPHHMRPLAVAGAVAGMACLAFILSALFSPWHAPRHMRPLAT